MPEPLTPHEAKLIASDGATGDRFGNSVALSGRLALVGSFLDDHVAEDGGSVYVFERQADGTWVEAAKLTASEPAEDDAFGISVALSGDRALIGGGDDDLGVDSGSVYIFERQADGAWMETAKLTASDGSQYDRFGSSVALSGDRALVGTSKADKDFVEEAYVFEQRADDTWAEVAHFTGEVFGRFAASLALSGDRALIGDSAADDQPPPHSGAVYVFERQADGTWSEVAVLIVPHRSNEREARRFGRSVALSGERALIGAAVGDSGAAHVFERQGDGAWAQVAELTASDGAPGDAFGSSVALSGQRALVVGDRHDLDDGAAYLFERQADGTWSELAKLTASDGAEDDSFGSSLALSTERALIAAPLDDDFGADSGSAYVYSLESLLRLDVSGTCPGSVTIQVRGAAAGGRVAMVASPTLGTFTLPDGRCAGIDVDLADPRLLGVFTADVGGNISRTLQVPPVACGAHLQALDVESCGTTNVGQLP